MFFFLILIQRNCSIFKIMIVNVKQMLYKILGQQTPGGEDVQVQYGPTPPPKFPDQVGLDVLFGGAARNRHMFGVSSGFVGIWRIWTLIGGFGRQSGPQKITHVFCFTPLPPPQKKWTNVPWKGTISKRKNRIPSPWFFGVNESLFFTRCFGAEISSPSLSESDKYSNSKPPAPGWLNSHQSKEGVPRTPRSAAVIEEFRRNFSPRKSDLAITQFGEGTSCR